MTNLLSERVVLVTGAARRVGKGIAIGFAQKGAHVVVHHGHSPEAAEATVREIKSYGVQSVAIQANLVHYDQIASLFEQIKTQFGRLDVLVNSASIYPKKPFLDIAFTEWQETLDTNLTAPFYCSQFAGRLMRDQHIEGAMVNIIDHYGEEPSAVRPHHSVSKAGLAMLTKVTARSLAPYKIRANGLILGPIIPGEQTPADVWQKVENKLPLKRSGTVEEVAAAAIFTVQNPFMTGALIHVDGGEGLGLADEMSLE